MTDMTQKESRKRDNTGNMRLYMAKIRKDPERYAAYLVTYRARNKRRRDANSHEELTYLVYSPSIKRHKIGKSTNVTQRLEALRVALPDTELIETYPYGMELERHLHILFKDHRWGKSEWFDLGSTEDAMVLIRSKVEEFAHDKKEAAAAAPGPGGGTDSGNPAPPRVVRVRGRRDDGGRRNDSGQNAGGNGPDTQAMENDTEGTGS